MSANRKRLLYSNFLARGGADILRQRDDIEAIPFANTIAAADFLELLKSYDEVNGIIVVPTHVGEVEIATAAGLQVVARIGVGFDRIDVPALTRHRIPLMTVGTANAPSVAEQAQFFILTLAKRGAAFNAMVKEQRWGDRLTELPIDLIGRTVLVVGFGRIGTRIANRLLAMEMNVLVYDPYVPAAKISAAGAEPVTNLDAALPRADFVSIHCPKTPETIGMFDLKRLRRMKPSAYLINTARGGIVEEAALHTALTTGVIAGAALDVFDREPPDPNNPLLKLNNVVAAPHMAGVTDESMRRMAIEAVSNVLSVFDGRPNRENVINPEVLP